MILIRLWMMKDILPLKHLTVPFEITGDLKKRQQNFVRLWFLELYFVKDMSYTSAEGIIPIRDV